MSEQPLTSDDTPPQLYPHPTSPASDDDSSTRLGKKPRRLRVLLIEDNPADARSIEEQLADVSGVGFDLVWEKRLVHGLDRLAEGRVDVVLVDLTLPESQGIDTFLQVHEQAPEVPAVVLTGRADQALAIEAMEEGAQDYLVKGRVDAALLVRSLRFAYERNRRRKAERALSAANEGFRVARQIQQKLFPAQPPSIAGLDIYGAAYPDEATGGDYFDYIPMIDGGLLVVIGDVTGHGFGPALLMASTRAYLHVLAQTHTDVCEMLRLINGLLMRDLEEERFVSLLLARLDPVTRSVVYSSAGHPSGYILDTSGAVKAELASTGPLLGVFEDATFAASPPIELDPGDILLLLTDGVTDTGVRKGQPFGLERALDVVRANRHKSARKITHALYNAVCGYLPQDARHDDVTAIVIKVDAKS